MLAEQRQAIADLIRTALEPLLEPEHLRAPVIELQRPKVAAHGDLSCTVALPLAKQLGRPARELATAIADALRALPAAGRWIEGIDVAGPGFINLRLGAAFKQQVIGEILRAGAAFGRGPEGGARRVVVEFVSANPTGPLHVGHARQAALGDALANVLAARGWAVQREFYYNDAGVQIDQLTSSVQARARELQGAAIAAEDVTYHGDYIVDVARDFLGRATVHARDGAQVTACGDPGDADAVRRFAVASLRHQQDLDLEAVGVRFDHFYLESSLYRDGRVDAAVRALVRSGLTFESEGALWLQDHGGTAGRARRAARRQGSGGAQVRRQLYRTSCRTWPTTWPSSSAGSSGRSMCRDPTTTAPWRGCAPACASWGRCWGGRSRPAIPNTCCTRWCA